MRVDSRVGSVCHWLTLSNGHLGAAKLAILLMAALGITSSSETAQHCEPLDE